MKTEALIILKKVQSLQRGQDLHDVGNSAQDAFTSWTLKRGYFLGGYVPLRTPNWHAVLNKMSSKIDNPF